MKVSGVELAELDPASIGSWPKQIRVALLVLSVIVTFILGYLLDLSDKEKLLNRSIRKTKNLSDTFSDTQNKVANLDDYKEEVRIVEGQLETLTEQLPKTSEEAGLLEDISQQAQSSDLRFISIKPLSQKSKGFYEEVSFELWMSGSFRGFGEFSEKIADMKRIVTFHDFEISRDSELSDNGFSEKGLLIRMIAKTYWASDIPGADQ